METVTADAFLVELFGQSVAVGNFGMAAMKRRIEAGDLRKLRLPLPERLIGPRLFGWWSGASGAKACEPLDHGVVDEDRLAVVGTAMHHAMADRDRQASDLCAQELHDLSQRRRHIGNVRAGPGLSISVSPSTPLAKKPRMDADAFDLAFQEALQPIAFADREQLKLDARAAGIDDEDGVGHGSGPDRLLRHLAVAEQSTATAQEAMRVRTWSAREVRMIGHPRAEHDARGIGMGEEGQVLGQHVAGLEIRHHQDLRLARQPAI